MTFFSVDVEADGPVPGRYSMLSIGVVAVRPGLADRFYCGLRPISDRFIPEALAVAGLDRDALVDHGTEPAEAMASLRRFVTSSTKGRPVFVADNPGFDFAFVSYYLHTFPSEGEEEPNPFGHSSRRIGDLWAGMTGDASNGSAWKSLRQTEHTHNALDDAIGNAEALLRFEERGLRIGFR